MTTPSLPRTVDEPAPPGSAVISTRPSARSGRGRSGSCGLSGRTDAPAGPRRAVAGLAWRLTRRGVAILAALLAGYLLLEIYGYRAAYPDQASRTGLEMFDRVPAVRMLQGPPHGLDTAGGFTAWDAGWVIAATVGIWAILVTTRLLRGEEDVDRAGVLLAAPLRARSLLALDLTVIGSGCLIFGATVSAVMIGTGEDTVGGLLFGATIAGFTAIWVAVAAVCAQVFDSRRHAMTAAAGLFALAYLVRLIANSSDSRLWLRRFTPWGWLDMVEPYARQRLAPVLWYAVAGLVLTGMALWLRGPRDLGGSLVTQRDRHPARLRWLGGPMGFAWRQTRGVLLAWAVGLFTWAAMVGLLLGTMLDFLAADEGYRQLLRRMGMESMITADGYLGVMAVLLGVCFALYAAWRMAAARAEEGLGRLDAVLARPVTRRRWLLGHLLLDLGSLVLLAIGCGTAIWLGAWSTSAELGLDAAVGSMLNQLPVAVFFAGLATAMLGLAPRLSLTVPAGLVGVGYVIELVGPALDWPGWVMDLSAFHHLAYVPADPFLLLPAAVLCALGVLAGLVGVEAFHRRDLVGD